MNEYEIAPGITYKAEQPFASKIPLPFFDQWTAALRGGEFEQGENWLNNDGKYCCLGVLCEIAGLKKSVAPDKLTLYSYGEENGESAGLPNDFPAKKILGRLGVLPHQVNGHKALAFLNDVEKFSFDQIAYVVEFFFCSEGCRGNEFPL
jgi:hypothetical protein